MARLLSLEGKRRSVAAATSPEFRLTAAEVKGHPELPGSSQELSSAPAPQGWTLIEYVSRNHQLWGERLEGESIAWASLRERMSYSFRSPYTFWHNPCQ